MHCKHIHALPAWLWQGGLEGTIIRSVHSCCLAGWCAAHPVWGHAKQVPSLLSALYAEGCAHIRTAWHQPGGNKQVASACEHVCTQKLQANYRGCALEVAWACFNLRWGVLRRHLLSAGWWHAGKARLGGHGL